MSCGDCKYDVIIIGGGISGTTIAESIRQREISLLLITASPTIKEVTNIQQQTKLTHKFDVNQTQASQFWGNILVDKVHKIYRDQKCVETKNHGKFFYRRLCVCTGCSPTKLNVSSPSFVVYLRDLTTLENLKKRFLRCKKIVILGNGGIASEIVHNTLNCDLVWSVRHDYINSRFLDAGSSKFLLQSLGRRVTCHDYDGKGGVSAMIFDCSESEYGCSPGAGWQTTLIGSLDRAGDINVKYGTELRDLVSAGDQAIAVFTDGGRVECDLLVCAIGVEPFVAGLFDQCPDLVEGGLAVDRSMRTSDPFIYSAGDCACTTWSDPGLWIQMRIWSQARDMALQAAQSLLEDFDLPSLRTDFLFNVFWHSTVIFGFKVVLLGLFNGQGLGDEYVVHLRVNVGQEYIKVVLREGRMVGAMLVGNIDLAETFENLIYDQLDLSMYGDQLLSTDIDIEDYFD